MDFANRGTSPVGTDGAPTGAHSSAAARAKATKSAKLIRIMTVVMLFAGTALAIALIVLFIFGRTPDESQYVEKKHYQAVFLNGGQVYFGKIGKFNEKYLTLSDIFYMRVNQQVQPGQTTSSNDVSLAKLGSELHGPEDQMVINRSEVQFWENLKDDGQVVKAITTYKANPNAASNTTTGTGSTTDTTTTTPAPTPTPTPSSTTKKP